MLRQQYVDAYIREIESCRYVVNEHRLLEVRWMKEVVLKLKGAYYDEEQIENCIKFAEKYFFKLDLFQKYLIANVFLFYADGEVVFDEFFITMARGNGKNGFISVMANYFISPLHGIQEYNVAITANSENQAMTSFKEVHNMLKRNPDLTDSGYFKNGTSKIIGLDTQSEFVYRANNAATQDSFRDGCLFFDEIHQFEDYSVIDVQTSGLGKRKNSRTFYIGTNGFVRDSVYDDMCSRARDIVESEELIDHMFPFVCTLDSPDEVEDENMWQKANPMFHGKMSDYAKTLFTKTQRQWQKLKLGIGDKARWLTKKMNVLGIKQSSNVATQEEIIKAARPYGSHEGHKCIGSVDLSSVKDFTAVGLLYLDDDENYNWYTHTFVLKEFLDSEALAAPIDEWEKQGLLTIVDGPLITETIVADWFDEQSSLFDFDTIVIDSYRASVLRPVLEDRGFEVEVIRRSPGVQAMIGTLLESLFANEQIIFGAPTMMRWYTFNVVVKRDKDGNPRYEKKEPIKRKTDGFMAFIHALYVFNENITEYQQPQEFLFSDFYSG